MKVEKYIDEKAEEITEFMRGLELADDVEIDVTRGKKLRGALTMLVSDFLVGDKKKALEFASAIELIHLGSLTHDDVIDEHRERRGTIPLHLMKGVKWAVLAGDLCFTLANTLASKSGSKESIEISKAMKSVLSGVIKEISINEFLKDIMSGEVSDKFYLKMIGLKTASLFESAGRFGAMSATEKRDLIDTFGQYSHYVGTAYQIADDLTDIIKMGEGKKEPDLGSMVAVIPAIFNYNRDYVKKVPFMIMSGRISVDMVLDMIASVDMSSKMKNDINKYISTSVDIIDNLEIKNEYKVLLKEYPEYCVKKILDEVGEKL